MIIKQLEIGYMDNFCYIVGCEETRRGTVIDPGGEMLNNIRTVIRPASVDDAVRYLDEAQGGLKVIAGGTARSVFKGHDVKGVIELSAGNITDAWIAFANARYQVPKSSCRSLRYLAALRVALHKSSLSSNHQPTFKS